VAQKEFIQNTILNEVKTMQNDLLTELSEKMSRLIETNFAAHFQTAEVSEEGILSIKFHWLIDRTK